MTESSQPGEGPHCAWCSAPNTAKATNCVSCGAALAQRESIGDVVVPGVTAVDPALAAIANLPMRLRGPSATQAMAGGAIAAAAAGGPVGLAALGGLAAVAATEYFSGGKGGSGKVADLDAFGRPSEAVLQALDRLEREGPLSPEPPSASDEAAQT